MKKQELIHKLMTMGRQDWDTLVTQNEAIRLDPDDPDYRQKIDNYLDRREQDLNRRTSGNSAC
jgi:hypothetical protein